MTEQGGGGGGPALKRPRGDDQESFSSREPLLAHVTSITEDYGAHDDGIDVDDDSSSSGDDVSSVPEGPLSCSSGMERIFVVKKLVRAGGSFRPSFTFEGFLAELSSNSAGNSQLGRVVAWEITLSVRYEPPSPKFAREQPECASYRVKFLQGSNFLYLLRGLPTRVLLDTPHRTVSWGALTLLFLDSADLDRFASSLQHVEVVTGDVRAWGLGLGAMEQLVAGMGPDTPAVRRTQDREEGEGSKSVSWSASSILSGIARNQTLLLAVGVVAAAAAAAVLLRASYQRGARQ